MAKLLLKLLPLAVLASVIPVESASANGGHAVWVSGGGTDTGLCELSAPCRTLAYAYSQATTTPVFVFVLDQDEAGPLTITQSTAILPAGAGALLAITSGNLITIAAGATDTVTIGGVKLVGPGASNGVSVLSAGDVVLDGVTIGGFANAAVAIAPTAGSVRVTVSNSSLNHNYNGVLISSGSPGATGHLKLFDSLLIANANSGVSINGAGNNATLANAKIIGSATALNLISGATATSYGNNVLTSGSAPTTTLPLQ